ncbi:hypothetical protein [Dethiothermospora halolimnae]|uniref:hypothetical protein n=1 Tax=Dethiothermospora halolimnae TaxID=3114390 RepID=UPI003CCBBB00
MINQFIQEKEIEVDERILWDIKRIFKNIDLENINIKNRMYIFNKIGDRFEGVKKHTDLLTRKGKEDTLYHKELNLLKEFINYLIDLYEYPYSLDEIFKKKDNKTVYKVDGQAFVDDEIEGFEEAQKTPEEEFELEQPEQIEEIPVEDIKEELDKSEEIKDDEINKEELKDEDISISEDF